MDLDFFEVLPGKNLGRSQFQNGSIGSTAYEYCPLSHLMCLITDGATCHSVSQMSPSATHNVKLLYPDIKCLLVKKLVSNVILVK